MFLLIIYIKIFYKKYSNIGRIKIIELDFFFLKVLNNYIKLYNFNLIF